MTGEAISGDASPDPIPQPIEALREPVEGEALADPEDVVTDEPIILLTEHQEAQRLNGPLMARWSHETRTRLVMEFIEKHQLFKELNAFLRRHIR